MKSLDGKIAIIIGAAGGAGSGFARYFAAQGARLLVNDAGYPMLPQTGDYDIHSSSPDEAQRIASLIQSQGGRAEADWEDASDSAGAKRIVEHCLNVFGGVDIVIHASNVSRLGLLEELTDEDWDLVIRQNLYAPFYLTRLTVPHMRKRGFGRHIYLGSATVREMWGGANYAAASGGIYSLMRSVALECKDYGITANSIEPWTQTKTGQRPSGQAMLRARAKALGLSEDPSARSLPPGETNAPLGAYLCTDEGGMFNGQYFSNCYGRICIYTTPDEARYLYKDIDRHGLWTVEELTQTMPAALGGAQTPLWHPRG